MMVAVSSVSSAPVWRAQSEAGGEGEGEGVKQMVAALLDGQGVEAAEGSALGGEGEG